jgi:hypothetical protein
MKEGAALRHGCSAAPLLRSTVTRPWRGLGRGGRSRGSAHGKGRSIASGPCLRPLPPEPWPVTPVSSAPEVTRSESVGAATDVRLRALLPERGRPRRRAKLQCRLIHGRGGAGSGVKRA